MLEWVGGEFDPERFDREAVNGELRRMRTRKT
jgi:beta-galactosidase GanA